MAGKTGSRADTDFDIVLYTIKDIRRIFSCSETQAYNIAKANGFPSIRIGGKIYVEKGALLSWLDKNVGSTILL